MSRLGLYMRNPSQGWDVEFRRAYDAGVPYAVLKTHHPENYVNSQIASPGIPFVGRHWDDRLQGQLVQMAIAGRVAEAVSIWIAQFKDSVNQHIVPHLGTPGYGPAYMESMNEEWPTGVPDKLAAMVAFDREFIKQLAVACPGVRPIVFTAAIGNPAHSDAALLLPLARDCARADGAMAYHMYHSVYQGGSFLLSPPHQYDLHLRWDQSFDRYFVENGVRVKWLLSEGGPIGSDPQGYNPRVLDGWKRDYVFNANEDAFKADLNVLDDLLAATSAARRGDLIGVTLFLSDPNPGEWKEFNIVGSMLSKLTDVVISNPNQPPVPPPPPVPTRVLGTDVSRWQGAINWTRMRERGARFVFIKSSEHTTWVDPNYYQNIDGALREGLYAGAYHFYRPNYDPIQQANFFYATVNGGGNPTLPYVLDVEIAPGLTLGDGYLHENAGDMGDGKLLYEVDVWNMVDPDYITAFGDEVRQCLVRIKELTGRKPILYTNSSFYRTYLDGANLNEVADLWIAQWTTAANPTIPSDYQSWHFWQYTSDGVGPEWGVSSSRIDLNRFNGNYDDLVAYAASLPEPFPEYASTVSLMPPKNPLHEWNLVIKYAWPLRETIAWSAHDAVKLATNGKPGKVKVWFSNLWDVDIVAWLQSYGVVNIELWPR